MTTGKDLVRGCTMIGTADWVRDENVRLKEKGKPFLLPEGTAIVNGLSLAKNIDDALRESERLMLLECLRIAHDEGALNTARRINMILEVLEDESPKPEIAPSDNPLTVKAPV